MFGVPIDLFLLTSAAAIMTVAYILERRQFMRERAEHDDALDALLELAARYPAEGWRLEPFLRRHAMRDRDQAA